MRIRAGLISVMLVMMVAGCGGGPPPTGSPSPGSSAEPTLPSETFVPAEVTPEPSAEVTAEPEVTPEVTEAPAYTTYVVKKGDTLYAIALAHGTSVKKILAANPAIKDPQKLRIGQKITIPTS
jgi:2',3'-cyclic-nucleotide 2'-phosphodiesterase/3'-nucleotidase